MVFESELPFSHEAWGFCFVTCRPEGWKEKNDLFSVRWREPYVQNMYNDSHCPIQIETKVQNFSVDTELSLSHVEPVKN